MLEEGGMERSISVFTFVEAEPLHSDQVKNPQGKDSNAKKCPNTSLLAEALAWLTDSLFPDSASVLSPVVFD